MKLNPRDQDRTFCFCLVTATSVQYFFFEWKELNHYLQLRLLNTICGWSFVRDWNDDEYKFPTGKIIRVTETIKAELKQLREEFLQDKVYQEHKLLISQLFERISSLKNNELFFIYRIVYSLPRRDMLYRICTELQYVRQGKTKEEADSWFKKEANLFYKEYEVSYYCKFKQGEQKRDKRVCRFCGKKMPETTFNKDAHVVPESIGGSKELLCYEECDNCNEEFGKGIEQNLCRWFDFRRSLYRIRKKSGGIPKAYGQNYVIEDGQINILVEKIQDNKVKVLGAELVTLQGIYRALCKIAIDLIDSEHLSRLQTTIRWICTGSPKSCHYPPIAQLLDMPYATSPSVYIFTRRDGLDKENAPFHFCILHIFDLAFLYILPHVDGRVYYDDDYAKGIPTEALKILGFHNDWIWESYDTNESRFPHAWIDFSDSEKKFSDKGHLFPKEKLRKERQPEGYIDFPSIKLTEKDFLSCVLQKLEYSKFIKTEELKYCIGEVIPKVIFDLENRQPLRIYLDVRFIDVRTSNLLAEVLYNVQIAPKAYKGQINITSSSIYPNPELFVKAFELTLDSLFRDIQSRDSNFPFTKKHLNVSDCRELLDKIILRFIGKINHLKR